MGLALWAGMALLGGPLMGAELTRAGALALLIAGGLVVYAFAVICFGAVGLEDIRCRFLGRDSP